MKHIRLLFCFELLMVLVVCMRGYVRWGWPIYLSIAVGILAVVLLFYYHARQTRSKEKRVEKYKKSPPI
ncbi:ATP synthase subunit I [Bacillus pfraonensis]|uniref:ATP synthase subunit I n=1 Tax=Bacillus TaxID=1386 RepID=UPI002A4F0555|nr:ATP synthase subunit I [Bacillus pseudomycoides]